MGNTMNLRNCAIHGPGRGKRCASTALLLTSANGSAKPSPRAQNMPIACQPGKLRANPRDAPMNGAVQGEATTTANTPDSAASLAG